MDCQIVNHRRSICRVISTNIPELVKVDTVANDLPRHLRIIAIGNRRIWREPDIDSKRRATGECDSFRCSRIKEGRVILQC